METHLDILKQLVEYWWNKNTRIQWTGENEFTKQFFYNKMIYDYLKRK